MGKVNIRSDSESREQGIEWISTTGTVLKPGQNLVCVDTSSGAVTVQLPPLSEAAGEFYYFIAPSGSSNDASILDDTGTEITTYGDLDTDDDELLVLGTGQGWLVVVSNLT